MATKANLEKRKRPVKDKKILGSKSVARAHSGGTYKVKNSRIKSRMRNANTVEANMKMQMKRIQYFDTLGAAKWQRDAVVSMRGSHFDPRHQSCLRRFQQKTKRCCKLYCCRQNPPQFDKITFGQIVLYHV